MAGKLPFLMCARWELARKYISNRESKLETPVAFFPEADSASWWLELCSQTTYLGTPQLKETLKNSRDLHSEFHACSLRLLHFLLKGVK